MAFATPAALQPARRFLTIAFLAASALLTGCATPYLDGAVKDVPASQFVAPVPARPVQVVVEFQTNGAANARATDLVKPMVLDAVKATGLFADVQDKPQPGAALLSVKINNVALLDDAFKKGFMTGLTFGVAGSHVTDGYACTVSYTAPGLAAPITKNAKHAIHTAMGSGSPPPGSVKTSGFNEAIATMVRQITNVALHDLSRDPAFK